MKLIVTVLEESAAAAAEVIRSLSPDHDGIEVRAEGFDDDHAELLRAATGKTLILTWRGRRVAPERVHRALAAGVDFVDVEYEPEIALEAPRERVVLSHHDFDGVGEVEKIAEAMARLRCAHTKIAVTPQSFADNERLLALLRNEPRSLTVIGMGERGLYSRILAPFLGSELAYVAATAAAAPGQLTFDRALEIYGSRREGRQQIRAVFAVVGDPAGHSRSPAIHNRMFREKGVSAAYTIASVERFDEVIEPFLRGALSGMSVTAPFKEEAFRFARDAGAEIAPNALACEAVNTLVRIDRTLVADNTDVDGFQTLIGQALSGSNTGARVAIVGAGGTARAAIEAARREGIEISLFNRTRGRLGAASLNELEGWRGDLAIDTTADNVRLPLEVARVWIRASYGGPRDESPAAGVRIIPGEELLEAQAIRQNELFCRAAS